MKLYGHPWSINTHKTLATIAEKGHEVPLTLVMLPRGEHKRPEYLHVHPFGKVPVIDDDGFVLYETRAINAYLDATLSGPKLVPTGARERARMDQWINAADSYFIPFAHLMIVELLFRRHLGGEQNAPAIAAGRTGIEIALDTLDRALGSASFLAGEAFSLADVHFMPYLEYMQEIGEGAPIEKRPNVRAWWRRFRRGISASSRAAARGRVARWCSCWRAPSRFHSASATRCCRRRASRQPIVSPSSPSGAERIAGVG